MSHSILLHCDEHLEVSVTREKQAIWQAHPDWSEQQFRTAWLKRKREIFDDLCNDDLNTTLQPERPGDLLPLARVTDQTGAVGGCLSGLPLDLADACRHSTTSTQYRRTIRLDRSSRLCPCRGTAKARRFTSTTWLHHRRTNYRCSRATTAFRITDPQPPVSPPRTTMTQWAGPRLAVSTFITVHDSGQVSSS